MEHGRRGRPPRSRNRHLRVRGRVFVEGYLWRGRRLSKKLRDCPRYCTAAEGPSPPKPWTPAAAARRPPAVTRNMRTRLSRDLYIPQEERKRLVARGDVRIDRSEADLRRPFPAAMLANLIAAASCIQMPKGAVLSRTLGGADQPC
jgi:hypothetical protein